MTTQAYLATFAELYGADISPTLVWQVTNAVLDKVIEWLTGPLDAWYPSWISLDRIVKKIRQDKRVINKAVYVALGVNSHGHKELLGLRMFQNEGAKFWLSVLTELKNRGVKERIYRLRRWFDGLSRRHCGGFSENSGAAVYCAYDAQFTGVRQLENIVKPWLPDSRLSTSRLPSRKPSRSWKPLPSNGTSSIPASAPPGVGIGPI